ncbi:MAG: methyltransferase domain-containing protein [Pseudomonadales bacterium]|nr:methyltransferase domain-containing protein [Pseudomonadales bacterium]
MFAGIDFSAGDLVIEYGPGTGAFTAEVARLRRSGRAIRYLGIERDPAMCRFLNRRYPELDIVCGDVADVAALHAERDLPAARAIVSGLPLILMDEGTVERILASSRRCLRPDGVFRTFTYLHCFPTRGAARLRARIAGHFESAAVGRPVLRNVPPALVLSGWPTEAARRAHGYVEADAAAADPMPDYGVTSASRNVR